MHVLHLFEDQSADDRPGRAIELTRAWVRGETTMTESRTAAFAANAAARDVSGAAGKRLTLPDKPRPCLMLPPMT